MNNKTIGMKTKSFWNSNASVSLFSKQPISEYWLDFFTSHKRLNYRAKEKVLDLGCGAGRNIKMFLDLKYDVYACDLHENMVRAAKKTYLKNIKLNNQDIEDKIDELVVNCSMISLPYSDDFFDIILSHGVYHNAVSLAEFKKALRESVRVLKYNGYLCFNIFSSAYIDKGLKLMDKNLYVTKEGLLTVLLSKKIFLNIVHKSGLVSVGPVIEYISQVSTGKRAVMRGVLRKKY